MSKSILQIIYSCFVQTTGGKNTKYWRNQTILKIGHHAKAIGFAKSSLWVKNQNSITNACQNPFYKSFRVVLCIVSKRAKGGFSYDRRPSQVADRRKFCDRLRSYGNTLLRSFAILRWWSQKIVPCSISFDRFRSCDHMETKVLRSAIETYPIILLILTVYSKLQSHKARMFVSINARLF